MHTMKHMEFTFWDQVEHLLYVQKSEELHSLNTSGYRFGYIWVQNVLYSAHFEHMWAQTGILTAQFSYFYKIQ
jgi:hypothetical protein